MDKGLQKRRIVTIGAIAIGAAAIIATGIFLIVSNVSAGPGIRVALGQLPDSLNPVFRQNDSGIMANDLLWNGLFGKGGAEDLAASIEMAGKDNHNWKVVLKETSWHDGRRLDAEDVLFTLKAYLDPANNSPWKDYLDNYLSSAERDGETAVVFRFRDPIPEFRVRSFLTFAIIPSRLEGKELSTNLTKGELERRLSTKPVGTGPFRFKEWRIGQYIAFEANEGYHGTRPGSPSIVLYQVFDSKQRKKGWDNGKYNIVPIQDPAEFANASQSSAIRTWNSRSFYTLLLNTKDPSLSDSGVRAALSRGVDAKAILESMSLDFPANTGIFPQDLFTRTLKDYDVKPFEPNVPQSAAALPAKLLLLVSEDDRAFGERVGNSIVDAWKKAGVDASMRILRGDTLVQLMARGEFQVALVNLKGFDSLYSDLAEYFTSAGRSNWVGLKDAELDTLFARLNRVSDLNVWLPTAKAIHGRFNTLAPAIPLFTIPSGAYVKGVSGFAPEGDRIFLSAETWRGGNQ